MISIEDPGAVIAAVPGWFGYVPRRSVVLILLSASDAPEGLVRATRVARVDLYTANQMVDTQAIAMAAFAECARYHPDAVCVVVVDDTPTTGPGDRYRALISVLSDRIMVWGTPLLDVWFTPAIEAGATWWSLLHPHNRARQPVPGSQVPGVLAPEPDRAAETARWLAAHARGAASSDGDDDWFEQHRARRHFVLRLVRRVEAGTWSTAQQVAELAVSLRDPHLHDYCYALGRTRYAESAYMVWTLAWQALPPGDRAHAALLTAVGAAAVQEFSIARAAVQSILIDHPDHPDAPLLSRVIADNTYVDLRQLFPGPGSAGATD
ncbi:hypothetical protein ABIA39_004510 [Nocardia sp. GAS34]